jgi:hypothetical protein
MDMNRKKGDTRMRDGYELGKKETQASGTGVN